MKKILIILVALLALAGIGVYKLIDSISRGGELGDTAVSEFHRQYNSREIAGIHAAAASDFRKAVPLVKFTPFATMLHQKLGQWKSGSRDRINLNNQNGNKTLELTYNSTFANGTATEDFVFDYNGDKPLLLGYNVKSPALLDLPALEAQPKAAK